MFTFVALLFRDVSIRLVSNIQLKPVVLVTMKATLWVCRFPWDSDSINCPAKEMGFSVLAVVCSTHILLAEIS